MAQDVYRIDTESPAGKDLMFWTLVGQEAMSQPSVYELRVLSKNDAIAAKDILGHAFDVVFGFDDPSGTSHERHCRGHAVRFARRGARGRYFEYVIELRSWFWLLEKRQNARIFQGQDVLEVMDAVVHDSPIRKLWNVNKDGIVGKPDKRPYCVQFEESDFRFVSRLLEEEGIYYWFDAHEKPGTMYLSNASDVAHQPLPVAAELKDVQVHQAEARFNELRHWSSGTRFGSGGHASRDSDFKAIRKKLAGGSVDAAEHELADLEVFEFPGGHLREADADKRSRIRMEELAARRRLYWAVTPWPDVAVGRRTRMHSSYTADDFNDEHLIVSCLMVATHPGYEGVDTSAAANLESVVLEMLAQDRVNEEHRDELLAMVKGFDEFTRPQWGMHEFLITSVPLKVPYRPSRLTPRVRMPGPQSAIVVGPEGDEIHADEFGRVKVHFHWDRYDESNEKSTCWVRVSQPWAGKGWGGYFIPRIGQEVIVDFLNGDPDRPIIMGRVYNDDQPIPFKKHEQSGFRTRSTPKGSAANFNEFRFDDTKGSEQVFLHAEKNQDIEVEADETHWVGHDRKKTIDHDETVHVKNDRTETVDNNEKITIGVNRTESVGANEDITIGASRTETVGANETISIGANRTETVGASESLTVGASRTDTVGAGMTQTIGAALTQTVGAAVTQTIGAGLTVTTGGPTTFMAAGGFNIIAPGGTKIIDFQLGQIGGQNQIGYGFQFNFSGINLEANIVKGEATACTNAAIGVKTEFLGVDTRAASAVQQAAALEALSHATGIEMDALKIFL